MKPRALDLFCGAGGACKGLQRAGFEVFGVDIKNQPNYPGWFLRADALEVDLHGYDLIWMSPPCQKFSQATPAGRRDGHLDLIDQVRTRATFQSGGTRFVIENVPQAPVRADLVLTGQFFNLGVIRRRHFEANFPMWSPGKPPKARGLVKNGELVTIAGSGSGKNIKGRWSKAMGIDWMTRRELAQAIPPAYAEFIAKQAIDGLRGDPSALQVAQLSQA